MTYYVIVEPQTRTFYGLTTMESSLSIIPEQFIIIPFEGKLPSDVSLWNSTSMSFVPQEKPLTLIKFLDRFTPYERIAIRTVAKTDPVTDDFIQILMGTPEVNLLDPMINKGLAYLVYLGILTQQRANEIGT